MYLRGLRAINPETGEEYTSLDEAINGGGLISEPMAADSGYSQSSAPSDSTPTTSYDWSGMFSTVVKTWGNLETTKMQTQAQSRVPSYSSPSQQPRPIPYANTGYSPFPAKGASGSGSSFDWKTVGTWAMAAIGALALFK